MSAICDAHKKKVGVEQLYNPGEDRQSDELEIRCGRENQHPAEEALRTPDWVVDVQISWREDAGMRTMSQRGYALRTPRLSNTGERERNTVMAIRVGVNMLQFSSASNSLSHSKTFSNPFEPFQIKWEVYFSKELCRSSLLCRCYDSACICIKWLTTIRPWNLNAVPRIRSF